MQIVLVHGAGGAPSDWSRVTPLLEERGIRCSVADTMSQSLAEDVANVRALVDIAAEPTILVGHSYGGAVITNAGLHDQVRGLVYAAAFAPGAGESVASVCAELYEDVPGADAFWQRGPAGEWSIPRTPEARRALAWDVPQEVWEQELVREQRHASDAIFTAVTAKPAWEGLPTWYVVATRDQHIPASAQRTMASRAGATVSEAATSHSIAHAAPAAVVAAIADAMTALA